MAKHVTEINVVAVKAKNPSVAPVREPQPLVGGFDYTNFDTTTAQVLRDSADQIRKSAGIAIISIGTILLRVKEHLKHGQFGPWLKAEFSWKERTAERYMTVAERFASKSELVSDLPPSLLYLLAAPSTPATIVAKVTEDIKAGQPIDRQAVVKEINAYRRQMTHPTSRTEAAPQHKSKKDDLAECIERRPQEKEEADLESDVHEVTAILAKLPKADLIRLGELLKKPDAWRCFVAVVDKAAHQAPSSMIAPTFPPA